jgi:hypothetical protein
MQESRDIALHMPALTAPARARAVDHEEAQGEMTVPLDPDSEHGVRVTCVIRSNKLTLFKTKDKKAMLTRVPLDELQVVVWPHRSDLLGLASGFEADDIVLCALHAVPLVRIRPLDFVGTMCLKKEGQHESFTLGASSLSATGMLSSTGLRVVHSECARRATPHGAAGPAPAASLEGRREEFFAIEHAHSDFYCSDDDLHAARNMWVPRTMPTLTSSSAETHPYAQVSEVRTGKSSTRPSAPGKVKGSMGISEDSLLNFGVRCFTVTWASGRP